MKTETSIKIGCGINYYEDYWDDDNVFSKGYFVNTQREGYWEFNFKNGKLWEKGHYKNNKNIGYWEEYSLKGKLSNKLFFI